MAKVVGDISVQVGADIAPLQRAMRQGTGSVRGFERGFSQSAARVGRAAAGIGAAAAAAAGAVAVMAANAANAGAQISRLAQVSNTSTTEFQRLAAAASTVGIEQDKLADILKDVNDRVGDFIATGGGPMADFFENIAPQVGVTADQFARLGGPEALQLYVTSLEKAGVTQAEMTFYLEAMASDLTVMLPLLRNSGAEMRRLGDEAEAAGAIMSEDAVRGATQLDRKLTQMRDNLRNSVNGAINENADEFIELAEALEGVIPLIGDVAGAIASVATAAINATSRVGEFMAEVTEPFREGMGEILKDAKEYFDMGEIVLPPMPGSMSTRPGASSRVPLGGLPGLGSSISTPSSGAMAGLPLPPETTETGGSGGSGLARDDFDVLRQRFATEYEIMAEEYERQQALLAEYHAAGIASETEYKEAMLRLEEDYGARKRRAVMDDLSGLTSLMQAENENLFKIGKAAALAQAIINGEEAATAAWSRGMAAGGPAVAAAFTAASLARTGISIQNIRNASIGGGGGGASSGGGAAAAPAAAPMEVNLRTVGSGDFIRRGDLGDLLNQLQDEAGDRGLRITYA
jgi:hypothetical protein